MTQGNLMPPSCQSCGIQIKHSSEFGTTSTGVISTEYCGYCFQNGNFTEPDITMEGMIEKLSKTLSEKERIDTEQAREKVGSLLPGLTRWQKKH